MDACCLGTQLCNSSGRQLYSRVRQLYRNTLMTDFARAFQNDHNNISDAVQQDCFTG